MVFVMPFSEDLFNFFRFIYVLLRSSQKELSGKLFTALIRLKSLGAEKLKM